MKINKNVCGIPIASLEKKFDQKIFKVFSGLFKIVKIGERTNFYFLGIKFFSKNNSLQVLNKKVDSINHTFYSLQTEMNVINNKMDSLSGYTLSESHNLNTRIDSNYVKLKEEITTLMPVHNLHSKVFPQFKNINKGKDVVIVGTGPTLNDYEPIKDAVHIGLNAAFKNESFKLNYLFMADYSGAKNYIRDAKDYDCKKLYGLHISEDYRNICYIPEYIVEEANAYRYFSNTSGEEINYDIEVQPLMNFGSVSFHAIHFALYTHPKRIYLVGCDCTKNGYYDKNLGYTNDNFEAERVIEGYKKVKDFVRIYYPDIEIISINPVGLKGIFKEIYTNQGVEV